MGIKTVQRPQKSLKHSLYISALYGGLKTTIKKFTQNISDIDSIPTINYPEQQPSDITSRYRGVHRLTKRADDTISCVACFMCATACPSKCIFIEATQRTDGVDEKMPRTFTIDMLECVFCGYCVEACPCDAIRMDSGIFTLIAKQREDFLYDKEKLLSIKGAFGNEVSNAK